MRFSFHFLRWPLLSFFGLPGVFARDAEPVDFSRDVRPILSVNCFRCHGRDATAREGHLRLDLRDAATLPRRDGTTPIVPGHPDLSELVARISTRNEDDRMPPADKARALTPAEIDILRRWIADGAPYTEHWAYRPLPAASPGSVDDFVRTRLARENLPSAPAASRSTLLRRASLDLTGLLPTPAELDAFLADPAGDDIAFARVIDRLLASPHYGERYGRHWLDVARYADSGGYDNDRFFGHAWRFRDYVVRAFNADKPFDRFVLEQIAGDELFPDDAEARLATGFYTVGPVPHEPAMDPNRRDYDQATDFVDTTGAAFLGLTVACARCHDHKYDPISQREYFSLQAIFAASDQFDYTTDGRKLREHAAYTSTFKEFRADRALKKIASAADPAQRQQLLQDIGDAFLESDRRYELTRRYGAIHSAVEMIYRKGDESELADTLKDGDDDDDATLALKAELRGLVLAPPADKTRAALFKVGAVALLNPLPISAADTPSISLEVTLDPVPLRRSFSHLKTADEKQLFLVSLGRRQIDRPKPAGYLDDFDAFRAALGAQHLDRSPLPVRVLSHRERPLEIRLLRRGEFTQPAQIVAPGLPEKFAAGVSFDAVPADRRRATLATWIVSPQNPLTARVIANRVWQWHFGEGLVRTPDDFGIRGEPPSHPELLDWLAGELVSHGWSLKHLHRIIMNSATYRQAATATPATLARDPENRLLTRFQPHRLEAEIIWDNFRAAAGTLDLTLAGLPVVPPLDDQELYSGGNQIPVGAAADANRRALYYLAKRSYRLPMLDTFDLPFNFATCGRRDISTTPTQALALLNHRLVREQAAAFADRLLRESRAQLSLIPTLAWRYAYGRELAPDERAAAARLLLAQADHPQAAVTELCLALFNTNEFIYQQ